MNLRKPDRADSGGPHPRRTLDNVPSPFALRFWGGHAVMVVLLVAAILLGVWQISVYESHRREAAINRTNDPAVALAAAIGPDQAFPGDAVGRPVTVDGTWLPQDTVLVSGEQQAGRDGYWVVTPLKVTASGSALPVVRGWIADPTSAPAAPTGSAQLTAWLQPSQADESVPGAATTVAGTEVLSSLRTAALAQRLDGDLYDGYAVARGGVGGLTQAELPAQPDAGFWTSLRNLLYGIQWWVFGGFAVLMWWRWLADARAAELDDGADPSPAHQRAEGDTPIGTVKT